MRKTRKSTIWRTTSRCLYHPLLVPYSAYVIALQLFGDYQNKNRIVSSFLPKPFVRASISSCFVSTKVSSDSSVNTLGFGYCSLSQILSCISLSCVQLYRVGRGSAGINCGCMLRVVRVGCELPLDGKSDGETGVPNDGVRDESDATVVDRVADWRRKPCKSSRRWTVSTHPWSI
jgi:hypothetical protein